MCQYAYVTYRCGHSELLAGPNCETLRYELSRIHREASAWTPEGLQTIPFTWQDSCGPGQQNTVNITSDNWCGWECRNSHPEPIDNNTSIWNTDAGVLGGQMDGVQTYNNDVDSYYVSDAGRMPWYFGCAGLSVVDGYADSLTDGSTDSLGDIVGDGIMDGATEGLMDAGNVTLGDSVTLQEGAEGLIGMASPRGVELGVPDSADVQRHMGMPDAEYGVPRPGVGWREDKNGAGIIQPCNWTDDGKVFEDMA
ncbi:hypothetical protein F4776DRAFT_663027 [Hypoxylon sp. NC0597]|nr:hypothetical protein F4776DRAFT_663027 [Hypoxylon sp. NC0597]